MMPPIKLGPSNLRPLWDGASVGAVVVASVVTLGVWVVVMTVVDGGIVVCLVVGGSVVEGLLEVVVTSVVVIGSGGRVTGVVGGNTGILPAIVLGDGTSDWSLPLITSESSSPKTP